MCICIWSGEVRCDHGRRMEKHSIVQVWTYVLWAVRLWLDHSKWLSISVLNRAFVTFLRFLHSSSICVAPPCHTAALTHKLALGKSYKICGNKYIHFIIILGRQANLCIILALWAHPSVSRSCTFWCAFIYNRTSGLLRMNKMCSEHSYSGRSHHVCNLTHWIQA